MKKLNPTSAEYQALDRKRKETAKAMSAMQKKFGITHDDGKRNRRRT